MFNKQFSFQLLFTLIKSFQANGNIVYVTN